MLTRIMRMITYGFFFVLLVNSSAFALPFQNGSFEIPGPSGSNILNLSSGSDYITGWVVSYGDIDLVDHWTASEGTLSIDLNGRMPGGIKQTFDTTPNQMYEVLFEMAANPGSSTTLSVPRTMTVGATDNTIQTFSFDPALSTSYTNLGWTTFSYLFQASGNATTLEFVSTTIADGTNYTGPALDNVRVSLAAPAPAPEPATMFLFVTGLIGLAGFRRKFKK